MIQAAVISPLLPSVNSVMRFSMKADTYYIISRTVRDTTSLNFPTVTNLKRVEGDTCEGLCVCLEYQYLLKSQSSVNNLYLSIKSHETLL